jgi:P-type Cu+ transporter
MVVDPGMKIPTDGAHHPGREQPRRVDAHRGVPPDRQGVGDDVFGATINQHRRLVVEATRVGSDTMLAQIVEMVEDAQATKAPVQRLVDRISAVFVPIVIVIAVITMGTWMAAGQPGRGRLASRHRRADHRLPVCPRAGHPHRHPRRVGRGAELGVLFKGAEVFERSRSVDVVAFDKTGTLTTGVMTLAAVETTRTRPSSCAGRIRRSRLRPPDRQGGRLGVEERDIVLVEVPTPRRSPEWAPSAPSTATLVVVGKAKLLADRGLQVPDRWSDRLELEGTGITAFVAGWDGEARGVIGVSDTIRTQRRRRRRRSLHRLGCRHRPGHGRQPTDGRSRRRPGRHRPGRSRGAPGRQGGGRHQALQHEGHRGVRG